MVEKWYITKKWRKQAIVLIRFFKRWPPSEYGISQLESDCTSYVGFAQTLGCYQPIAVNLAIYIYTLPEEAFFLLGRKGLKTSCLEVARAHSSWRTWRKQFYPSDYSQNPSLISMNRSVLVVRKKSFSLRAVFVVLTTRLHFSAQLLGCSKPFLAIG